MLRVALVAAALTLLSSFTPDPACANGACGLMPLKPLTPLGCIDTRAVCLCDSMGQNCSWQFICVPFR